jgi:NAD(P)-dependent dehydrogenase (short-subunit alcohol dehydrogenase family)
VERNLINRVAIVTGAARGIGLATAKRLAQAGALTAVADLDQDAAFLAAECIGRESYTAIPVVVDVGDEQSVQEMVVAVKRQLGAVDILVNNAGITGGSMPVHELDVLTWDRVMAVNLRGVFLCCRAVLPDMLARGKGRIINVASIAGKEGNPLMSAYSASKAGVIGFTKALAKEVAQHGIIVNAISPAVIQTSILEQLSAENIAYMVERIPMGRVGRPEEVAALIHWLASDECSFTTGQCIDISGGRATY